MLMTSCIKGLRSFWWNLYVKYKQQTTLCGTIQSDYSLRSGCPSSAKSVIWKSVNQFQKTGNVNLLKRVHWLTVVTDVGERPSHLGNLHNKLWMLYSSCCKAVKTLQLFPYKAHVSRHLLEHEKHHHYWHQLLAKMDNLHTSHITIFSDEAWFPSSMSCELSEYSHMVNIKSSCTL